MSAAKVWLVARAVPSWCYPLAVGVFVLFIPSLGVDYSTTRLIQLALILALVVSGLNLALGYGGELAFGQPAMYAAGAYTAGLMSKHGYNDLLLEFAVGVLAALVVGIVSGVPGLRLGSWSLGMTTFFLVLLIPDVVAMFSDRTGGAQGLTGITRPTFFGDILRPDEMYIVIVVVTILWFATFRNIVVSRHGTAFRVLKQSPVLAASLGISVFRMKLLAYAVGSVPAGLGGVLFANVDLYISPESFAFAFVATMIAAAFIGGTTSVYGALVGGLLVQTATTRSTDFEEYALIAFGVFLILAGVLMRGGLAQLGRVVVRRLDRFAGKVDGDVGSGSAEEALDLELVRGGVLEIDDLSKAFGGNQAVKGVSITARPGAVTALIGPNGSGKTTVLNLVSGFYRPDHGTIRVAGRNLTASSPTVVARAGVGRTFQTPNIPDGITVLEAVASGRYATDRASLVGAVLRTPGFRRTARRDKQAAHHALRLTGLDHLAHREAHSLPLGMRRLLEVARVVVSRPQIILFDEIASGLDEDEVRQLGDLIRRLRGAGATVVLVEHNFQLVLELADEIHVLARGQLLAHGTPGEIESDARVAAEYLGLVPTEAAVHTDQGSAVQP